MLETHTNTVATQSSPNNGSSLIPSASKPSPKPVSFLAGTQPVLKHEWSPIPAATVSEQDQVERAPQQATSKTFSRHVSKPSTRSVIRKPKVMQRASAGLEAGLASWMKGGCQAAPGATTGAQFARSKQPSVEVHEECIEMQTFASPAALAPATAPAEAVVKPATAPAPVRGTSGVLASLRAGLANTLNHPHVQGVLLGLVTVAAAGFVAPVVLECAIAAGVSGLAINGLAQAGVVAATVGVAVAGALLAIKHPVAAGMACVGAVLGAALSVLAIPTAGALQVIAGAALGGACGGGGYMLIGSAEKLCKIFNYVNFLFLLGLGVCALSSAASIAVAVTHAA